jgi:hypothetical protein
VRFHRQGALWAPERELWVPGERRARYVGRAGTGGPGSGVARGVPSGSVVGVFGDLLESALRSSWLTSVPVGGALHDGSSETPISAVGTATAVSSDTLTDNTKSWSPANWLTPGVLTIVGGTGAGVTPYSITASTTNTITISGSFSPAIDTTSIYTVGWSQDAGDYPSTIVGGSPISVQRRLFQTAGNQGAQVGIFGQLNSAVRALYFRFYYKQDANADNSSAGTKLIRFEDSQGGSHLLIYEWSGSLGAGHIGLGFDDSSDFGTNGAKHFNVPASPYYPGDQTVMDSLRGAWHLHEGYVSRATGALKLWIDGYLCIDAVDSTVVNNKDLLWMEFMSEVDNSPNASWRQHAAQVGVATYRMYGAPSFSTL